MRLSWQPASRLPRWPWWAVLAVGAWSGLVFTAACLSRYFRIDLPMCLFKQFTGLPCPTCGGTRGVLALLGGHVVEGFLYNPLLFGALFLLAAHLLMRVLFARRLVLQASLRRRALLWIALGGLIVLNWAYLIWQGK